MNSERDALEILVNLHYLIKENAENPVLVRTLVHQAVGPVEYLIEHCADATEPLDRAA